MSPRPRLTPRGRACLGAGLGALGVGLATGSLAAGALGLTLLTATLLALVPRRLLRVEVERVVEADVTQEGLEFPVRLRARCASRTWGRWDLEEPLPGGLERTAGEGAWRLDARSGVDASTRLVARIPGRFTWPPLRLRGRDLAGLAEVTQDVPAPARLTAYPTAWDLREPAAASRLVRVLSGLHQVRQGGPGSEFYALREFQEGDPLRSVNWRASARGGKMLVNQRERESHARVTLLLDGRDLARAGTLARNAWVLGLRAVATLARANFRMRETTRVLVYGDGVAPPLAGRAGDAAQLALLDALLDHRPRGSTSLSAAVASVLPHLRPKEPVVILSHLLEDAGAEEAVARLRSLEGRVTVLALDGPGLLRAAGEEPSRVDAAAQARRALVAALRARGATVVDWDPDLDLPTALLQAVLP